MGGRCVSSRRSGTPTSSPWSASSRRLGTSCWCISALLREALGALSGQAASLWHFLLNMFRSPPVAHLDLAWRKLRRKVRCSYGHRYAPRAPGNGARARRRALRPHRRQGPLHGGQCAGAHQCRRRYLARGSRKKKALPVDDGDVVSAVFVAVGDIAVGVLALLQPWDRLSCGRR